MRANTREARGIIKTLVLLSEHTESSDLDNRCWPKKAAEQRLPNGATDQACHRRFQLGQPTSQYEIALHERVLKGVNDVQRASAGQWLPC
jgi:hypothetical protein